MSEVEKKEAAREQTGGAVVSGDSDQRAGASKAGRAAQGAGSSGAGPAPAKQAAGDAGGSPATDQGSGEAGSQEGGEGAAQSAEAQGDGTVSGGDQAGNLEQGSATNARVKHEIHIYIFEHPTDPSAVGHIDVDVKGFAGFSSALFRKATEQAYRVMKMGQRKLAHSQPDSSI